MPWWNKYTLSVQEAAEYFGFSDKKVRKIIDEHETDNFVLWNGTRPRIKRQLFEKFVDEKLNSIINKNILKKSNKNKKIQTF